MKNKTQQLQIGQEYVGENEDAIIQEMVNEMQVQMTRMYEDKSMKRQIHTKMHGLVKGKFNISKDLPEHLKVGLFKDPKEYHCYVRFSNSQTTPQSDKKKDIRGIAIKLLNVEGEKILNNKRDSKVQDFLLMSSETFFSKNITEFRKTLKASTSKSKLKLLFYFLNPKHWGLLKRLMKTFVKCDNPLNIQYWSTQPYRFGKPDQAVKYFLKPSADNYIINENTKDENFLRLNLSHTLHSNMATFDFYIQFQTHAQLMPIEDPTVAWNSEFFKVATLEIPAQDFNTPEMDSLGENMSFNSWHSLTAHRPLGSFNRARKRAYEAMSAFRHEHNKVGLFEPEDSDDFLNNTSWPIHKSIPVSIPKKKILTKNVQVFVNCSRKAAFDFISSNEQLPRWLKKSGNIHDCLSVEVLTKGSYDRKGARRLVYFEGGDTLIEELIRYNPSYNYAYKIYDFTNTVKKFTHLGYGQFWFDTVGDKTRISWYYSFTYKNFFSKLILSLILSLMFKSYMKKNLKNAKDILEKAE